MNIRELIVAAFLTASLTAAAIPQKVDARVYTKDEISGFVDLETVRQRNKAHVEKLKEMYPSWTLIAESYRPAYPDSEAKGKWYAIAQLDKRKKDRVWVVVNNLEEVKDFIGTKGTSQMHAVQCDCADNSFKMVSSAKYSKLHAKGSATPINVDKNEVIYASPGSIEQIIMDFACGSFKGIAIFGE